MLRLRCDRRPLTGVRSMDDPEHACSAERSGQTRKRDCRDDAAPRNVELEAPPRRRFERAYPLAQSLRRNRPRCLQLRGELLEAVVYELQGTDLAVPTKEAVRALPVRRSMPRHRRSPPVPASARRG